MDTWSLPKTRPISCNDCPAFHRLHMSFRCCSESLTRRLNVINTTFREKIYTRWCCIDRLSWQHFPGSSIFCFPTIFWRDPRHARSKVNICPSKVSDFQLAEPAGTKELQPYLFFGLRDFPHL